MSLTPIPPPPPPPPRGSAPLVQIFCLTGHNGPLPAELKFKAKTVKTSENVVEMLAIASASTNR